ncbi:MAG TPA: hypothetical protein VF989_13730 [Polyangiaceae bacterium]|jgi:hypothetical protein
MQSIAKALDEEAPPESRCAVKLGAVTCSREQETLRPEELDEPFQIAPRCRCSFRSIRRAPWLEPPRQSLPSFLDLLP